MKLMWKVWKSLDLDEFEFEIAFTVKEEAELWLKIAVIACWKLPNIPQIFGLVNMGKFN